MHKRIYAYIYDADVDDDTARIRLYTAFARKMSSCVTNTAYACIVCNVPTIRSYKQIAQSRIMQSAPF